MISYRNYADDREMIAVARNGAAGSDVDDEVVDYGQSFAFAGIVVDIAENIDGQFALAAVATGFAPEGSCWMVVAASVYGNPEQALFSNVYCHEGACDDDDGYGVDYGHFVCSTHHDRQIWSDHRRRDPMID